MPTTQERWYYNGDSSLEYGGVFVDLSTFKDGYCNAVRVTDLDSACGFRGAVLIEHVVILIKKEQIRSALQCCGQYWKSWMRSLDKRGIQHVIADSLLNYGCYDPDDCWDGSSHHSEVVQCESDGPMKFDGWKANKRISNTTLEAYVESQHLNY